MIVKKKSSIKGKHRWSEESRTTKTNNKIRVSYHREETVEQENGDKHVTSESYVKYYTETEYAKKRENKKFWKKFWNLLKWMLTTLALVGTLYISILGYQHAGDPLYANYNQSINDKQIKRNPRSDTDQKVKWDSSTCSSKIQTQSNLVSRPELGPNKATNRPTGRQPMTFASSQQSVRPSNQNETFL